MKGDQGELILQVLCKEDLPCITKTFNFPWTTLQATEKKWEHYYSEQQAKKDLR